MRSRPAVVAAALVGVVALSACGSTRFVVVDNEGRRDAPAAAPVAGDTTPAAPGSTARDATAGELATIRRVVAAVFSTDPEPMARRLARVEGGDDLGPTVDAVLELVRSVGAVVTVDAATVGEAGATARVSVTVGDEPFASDVPVELLRSGDGWKVTRAGACAVLSLGSPCPDASG